MQVVGQPLFERWAKQWGKVGSRTLDSNYMDRGENGELLSARMQMWCKDEYKEVLDALDEARIPFMGLCSVPSKCFRTHI